MDPATRGGYARAMLRATPLLALTLALLACDSKPDAEAADKAGGDAKSVAASGAKAVAGEAGGALSEEARFDKKLRKEACALLTPKMVADAFGVPAGELKQMKVGGCLYKRKSGEEIVEASIMTVRVHDSEKRAAAWFANATKNRTKEEVGKQLEEIKKRAQGHEKIDTKQKKETAGKVVDLVGGMTPDEGFQYEDVPGVGDEARVNVGDGKVRVRLDNLTFAVTAYQGKRAPEPDFSQAVGDSQKMVAMAQAAAKRHMKETAPKRRQDATKLAKAIVAALE